MPSDKHPPRRARGELRDDEDMEVDEDEDEEL